MLLIVSVGCTSIKYKKVTTYDDYGYVKTTLKIEDNAWEDNEIPLTLNNLVDKVYKEKLYVNKIKLGYNRKITVYASNTPTYLKDIRELKRHEFKKIKGVACDCRLCK